MRKWSKKRSRGREEGKSVVQEKEDKEKEDKEKEIVLNQQLHHHIDDHREAQLLNQMTLMKLTYH